MDYKLTEGQIILSIVTITGYAKECDAQGRDKHALAKFLTVH